MQPPPEGNVQAVGEEVGQGGTMTTVDGVQFWDNGAPNRKFVVVGIIDEDFRWDPTPKEKVKWAQAVHAAGGDAVIFPSRDARDELTAKVVKIL